MAKKRKENARNGNILFATGDETNETTGSLTNDRAINSTEPEKKKNFLSGLGRGERTAVIGVCLLLVVGALGAGLGDKIISTFSSKNPNQKTNQSARNNDSYLSSLNPFAEPPLPTAIPQLSKEITHLTRRDEPDSTLAKFEKLIVKH
ncbi:MAG: hypothetical protein ACR2MG_09375 [Pyrinomonadaceae bacterium]